MKGTKLASRYAKALLELAIDLNKLEEVSNDMIYLLEADKETREFQLFLDSPIIPIDKKIAVFQELFGQFEDVSMNFVKLVTKNRRESYLTLIAREFDSQVKEYKGIVPVTLISAKPLDASVRATIMAKIQATVKGELEVKEQIDEALIGGFIVRMGDKQIDASVASELNNLKQRLTH
jgi:F-type H+-transporting ATPase subunit delta